MNRGFVITLIMSITSFATASDADDVRDKGKAATVKVTSEADRQFGSGVIIAQSNSQTYVLTAEHLVPTAKKVEVKLASGKTVTAEVLERSPEKDLAVLRILGTEGFPKPVKLAAERVKPKSVISFGWEKGDAPTSLNESLRDKVSLKKPGATNTVMCWEIERKPAAGRSGGALVNESGLVVGLATGHDGTSGYYVHSDEIHTFLRQNGLKWLTEE